MEAITLFAAAVAIVGAFGLLAGRFGTDSRERIGDDHRRPARA
jgi:hypothetical protein